MHVIERSIAAVAVTFVATKVTKKASAEMLLCALSLCLANQSEPRAAIICPAALSQSPASAKLAMPLRPHSPPLFCPLSPEAVLLTGRSIYFSFPSFRRSRREGRPA